MPRVEPKNPEVIDLKRRVTLIGTEVQRLRKSIDEIRDQLELARQELAASRARTSTKAGE